VNLCHFFDFCQPKNPLEKDTPPYGTARGDPILMEGTVYDRKSLLHDLEIFQARCFVRFFGISSTPMQPATCSEFLLIIILK
jgi:hypothetical protein